MKIPAFDWTIKVSDILVALTLVMSGFAAWHSLDTRVTQLETVRPFQAQIDAAQDKRSDELKADVLNAIKELHSSVDRLGDRLDNSRKGP